MLKPLESIHVTEMFTASVCVTAYIGISTDIQEQVNGQTFIH